MKKTRRILLTVLSVLTVAAVSLGAASCELLEILSQSIPPINIPTWDKSSLDNSTGDSSSESSSMEDSSSEDSSSAHTEHTWAENYSYDDAFHWIECTVCHEIKDKSEHTTNESGECSVCKALLKATEGVQYRISSDNTYAEVIGYEGTATRVRIADTYNNMPVKTICEYAFFENGEITSVTIPDSVTSIEIYAFAYCDSLTSVEIPDSVTSIGEGAFGMCTNLASIEIPDSVVSIGGYVFCGCSSLTSVVIGGSVTSIGDAAFYLCSSLTSVVIGDSVTSIGNYAFCDCSSLTSVVIPDSVTSIGKDVFDDCSSLTSVYYKGTESEWDTISIGSQAFYNTNATKYYYSETEPTEEGNYWHYVDGVSTVW